MKMQNYELKMVESNRSAGQWNRVVTKITTALLLTIYLGAGLVFAQPSSDQTSIDPVKLESFADGVVSSYMRKDKLPGVTLTVVKDGEIALLKGYGIAGVDPKRAVDPETTLFRIASISKTFVWTAVMQLKEQGLLSLDDPVNQYLPDELQIPDEGFDEPVRIWHLMTHTPGFEETTMAYMATEDDSHLRTLHQSLERYRPHRVRPAGDFSTYSNYGAALAGYIVARLSGTDFETYVEEHIYAPLGMNHATFREPHGDNAPPGLPAPMPESVLAEVATGFDWSGGTWQAQEFEFISKTGPDGAMSASAASMARYMIAHLQNGELDGVRILEKNTAEQMHTTLFTSADGVNGFSHGFMQYKAPGGYTGFGHGGALLYFMSSMVMFPELDLGVFISTNSGAGRDLVVSFPKLLIAQFFKRENPAPEPPADFVKRGQKYAGTYFNTRRSYTLLDKILSFGSVTEVSITDDGFLLTVANGQSQRWVEAGEHLFREAGGDRTIGFREDDSGNIGLIFSSSGTSAGERIGFFGGLEWIAILSVLGLLSVIGIITGAWLRRRQEVHQSNGERYSAQLMTFYAGAWLIFMLLMGGATVEALGMGNDIIIAYPTSLMIAALAVLVVAAVLTIPALYSIYPVWRDANWPIWRRIRHTSAIVILTLLVLTLNHWNMLGFKWQP